MEFSVKATCRKLLLLLASPGMQSPRSPSWTGLHKGAMASNEHPGPTGRGPAARTVQVAGQSW